MRIAKRQCCKAAFSRCSSEKDELSITSFRGKNGGGADQKRRAREQTERSESVGSRRRPECYIFPAHPFHLEVGAGGTRSVVGTRSPGMRFFVRTLQLLVFQGERRSRCERKDARWIAVTAITRHAFVSCGMFLRGLDSRKSEAIEKESLTCSRRSTGPLQRRLWHRRT